MSGRTLIFAKRPEPGQVKTRLVPPLAPAEAAELALAMLDDLVERLSGGPLPILQVAPEGSEAWFRARYPALEARPQRGAGLGERLAAAFDEHLAQAATVVAVGADAPELGAAEVAAAHARLAAGAELVLAPDGGGGYALVGLAAPAPSLFMDVPMSTSDNLERTLAEARRLGLAVELLAELRDVDRAADLAWLARLARAGGGGLGPRARALGLLHGARPTPGVPRCTDR